MAKGKHSAALFEVINSPRNLKRPDIAAESLRTPRWWFKGGQSPRASQAAQPASPPSFAEPETQLALLPTPARARVAAPIGSRSAVHLAFDPDQKEFTLRMRYTTALVGLFVFAVVIALAYVVGRHINHGPQIASAADGSHVSDLRTQPPQPDVTDIKRARPAHPIETPFQDTPRHVVSPAIKAHDKASQSLVPASAETSLPRVVGLNYLVIQSYPPQEEQTAKAALNFLNTNGIPCTLEKLPDYNPRQGWVCLTGTAGFSKIRSTDFETYVTHIKELGEKFPSSKFDHFDPHAYKWKG